MKVLAILCLFFLGLFFYSPKAFADCTPIYGGGSSCTNTSLTITKEVLNVSANKYVHDLGVNDPRYHQGDEITFRITLEDTGNTEIHHVVLEDILPQYITNTNPSMDPATSTITINVGGLEPNKPQVYVINGVLDNVPQSSGIICENNTAQVTADGISTPIQDFSQFCIESGVVTPTSVVVTPTPTSSTPTPTLAPGQVYPATPPTQLPPTGPEVWSYVIPLVSGGVGLLLRRLTKRKAASV